VIRNYVEVGFQITSFVAKFLLIFTVSSEEKLVSRSKEYEWVIELLMFKTLPLID
jgi:hypothetical protein